jgi:hypothetical protein
LDVAADLAGLGACAQACLWQGWLDLTVAARAVGAHHRYLQHRSAVQTVPWAWTVSSYSAVAREATAIETSLVAAAAAHCALDLVE